MIGAVASSLLATAIGSSVSKGYRQIRGLAKEGPYEIFESEFRSSLAEELDCDPSRLDSLQIDSLQEHTSLGSLKDATEEVSDRLSNSIEGASQTEIEDAVSLATTDALEAFLNRASEEDVTNRIQIEADLDISQQLATAREELEALRQQVRSPQYYSVISAENSEKIRNEIYDRGGVEKEPKYVDRPEFSGVEHLDNILIIGRKGSGKTRSLAELTERVCKTGEIDDVVIPSDGFTQPADLNPILAQDLGDTVLLVWDDIHDISPATENHVFRESLLKLRDKIEDLRVLATARSEARTDLPNYEKEDDRLWTEFEEIELEPLERDLVTMLIQSGVSAFDIEASYEVRKAFVERVLETDPSPFYIFSVMALASEHDDKLTPELVSSLPEDALKIWVSQYTEIKQESDNRRFILWAIRILSDIGIPPYRKLIRGIFSKVLERNKYEFEPSLDRLIAAQWLGESIVEETDESYFRIHDIQIEAVDESFQKVLDPLSDFIRNPPEWTLPEVQNMHARLNNNLASFLAMKSPFENHDLIEIHYQRANELGEDYVQAKTNYGNYLIQIGEYEDSERILLQALQAHPTNPSLNAVYGKLLSNQGDVHQAESYLDKALELDPNRPIAHHDKAEVLVQLGELSCAKSHIETALKLDPYSSESRNTYGNILRELGYPEQAKKQFNYAIQLDTSYASPLVNLGITYLKEDELEEAERYLREGLKLGGERQEEAINNLVSVLLKDSRIEDALSLTEEHLRTSDSHLLQNTAGAVYSRAGKYEQAEAAFKQALSMNPYYDNPKKNLQSLYSNHELSLPPSSILQNDDHSMSLRLAIKEIRLRQLGEQGEFSKLVEEVESVLNEFDFEDLDEGLAVFEDSFLDLYLKGLNQTTFSY